MPGWLSWQEAMAYFGLDDQLDLERIAVEHGLDVDVDAEGHITLVDADDAKRALFAEHERAVGHRPDDPAAHAKAQKGTRAREASARRRRRERRARLEARVRSRGSLTEG